jgi:hypothetical protein
VPKLVVMAVPEVGAWMVMSGAAVVGIAGLIWGKLPKSQCLTKMAPAVRRLP